MARVPWSIRFREEVFVSLDYAMRESRFNAALRP